MNEIAIYPKEIENLEAEGIVFKNSTFIGMMIDGELIDEIKAFEDGTVYWPELKRSLEGTGKYLIFTCICGVAEDAGWEEINVIHSNSEVAWKFERDGEHKFIFDKADYLYQIQQCEKILNLKEFPLAVENATFPINDNI